jgi:flagellum-specific ATP synthase
MATWRKLIRLGPIGRAAARKWDGAIALHRRLEEFLAQDKDEATTLGEGYQRLEQILAEMETEN